MAASRRSFIAGAGATGAALLASGCKPILSNLLTSADAHPADFPTVQAVEYMGRLLAERTGGRLGIKVFAGGQLGSENDTLEITSFGGLDFTRVFLSPLNSIERLTIPFALPFLFKSTAHMRRVMDSPVADEVAASLEQHRLIGLVFYDSGARSFYNIRRPIVTPADMQGLKLRVPGSDLAIAMINALGANAVPIPYGEVYQALAQGVIDGAENNLPSFQSARHYEVANYLSLTEHLYTPEALVMSKASWDRMPPSDQALVRQAARDSVPYMRQQWDARVSATEAALVEAGITINRVDQEPFAALMRPVWDQFVTTPQQRSIVDRIIAMGDA